MRTLNNERTMSVFIIAVVLLMLLITQGCTQVTPIKQLCGSAAAKSSITQGLLAEGMTVNKFYQGYMIDIAEVGAYNYVAEGASICWIQLTATTTKLTEYNKETYGYTYAVWSIKGVVRVRHIGLR